MVWQYITFPTLTTLKKGLLLTVIRIQGTAEARRCGAVAVRSQVITWSSTLTLYALYMSRPLPPFPLIPAPPLLSQARSLITTLVTLTRGIQGCPKTISFDKSTWHPTFEKTFPILFFFAAWRPCFFRNTLCRKMLPLLHYSLTRKSFSRSFFRCSFFTLPSWMPTTYAEGLFETSLFNPAWRVPGFMEGGEGKQITSIVTQFYCPLSPNSQTSEFLLYSFCTFKNFC